MLIIKDEPTFGFDTDTDNCQSWPSHYNFDPNHTDLSNSEDCVRLNDLLPNELFDNIKASLKSRECDAYLYDAHEEKCIDLLQMSMEPMLSSPDADYFNEKIKYCDIYNPDDSFADDIKMQYDHKPYMKSPVLNNDPMLSSTFDLTLNSQPNQSQANTSFAVNHLHNEAITYQTAITSNPDDSNKSEHPNDMHAERTTTNQLTNQMQMMEKVGPVCQTWASKKHSSQPLRFSVPFNSQGAAKCIDADLSTPQIIDSVIEMDQTPLTPIANEMTHFDLVDFIVGSTKENSAQLTETIMEKVNQPPLHTIKIEDIQQALPTPAPTPTKRSRENSCETSDSSSIRSTPRKRRTTSRYSEDDQPKRPRGRPPKTEPEILSLAERRRLSATDLRHKEMRIKNNESSRRSRANRKGKEGLIIDQLQFQEKRFHDLQRENEQLELQVALWHKRVFKLATINCA